MTSVTRQETQPKITFIVRYQCFLAVAAILIFFTKFDSYLAHRGIGLQLYWMIAFIGLSVPLFRSSLKRLNCISKPMLLWCGGYLAVPCISILILPKFPELQALENQLRTTIFLLLMLAIFSYHPIVSKWVKLTILLVTFINIGMFVYEFFIPSAFYLEQHAAGRASGFYKDSNTATIVLILGMIFTIDLFKPKYRLFYALLVFVGLAPTFSRGGIVGWIVVLFIFLATKMIPRYQIPLLFLSSVIFISILTTQLNNLSHLKTADGIELFNEGTIARVEFLINPLGQKDDSQAGRLNHLDESWQKFARHPFVGGGLGNGKSSTVAADHNNEGGQAGQRSHNTYLDLMLEFGFLGALLYPWLILATVWKAQGEFKKQAIALVFFLLTQGFFTHTIMHEFCTLSVYAIAANFTMHSRLENI